MRSHHEPNSKDKLMQATRLYTAVLLASFIFSTTASAQVFDSGPSNPAMFTNVFNLPVDVVPSSIPVGTTQINVASGGFVQNGFSPFDITEINVSGGAVGNDFILFDTEVNIYNGTLGDNGLVLGGEVNISGGTVGDNLFVEIAQVNISGGTVGDSFGVNFGEVNISGGTIGSNFFADFGEVNISGGTLGDGFSAQESTVNLSGSDFALDGVLLNNLVSDQAFTILDRDVTLTGLLEDGSPFSFDLDDNSFFFSTLTVKLSPVPEPTSMAFLLLGCGLAGMRRVRSAATS